MNKKGSTSIFFIILALLVIGGYLMKKGIITINIPSVTTTTIGLTTTTIFPEEFCQKKDTDIKLSLSEAKDIAFLGECGDRLKDTYICNEVTGTWWINLDIEKEGCNPACVINVETKTAEINWRCTGLIPM
ncbi:MAG: hypothetical protein KAS91_00475 [Candidatus Pacebacteria bacterium]|nr:hypothetical protein [Candidatus Paceibacterota bacterium]